MLHSVFLITIVKNIVIMWSALLEMGIRLSHYILCHYKLVSIFININKALQKYLFHPHFFLVLVQVSLT